jgi:predicted transcriptional regulator
MSRRAQESQRRAPGELEAEVLTVLWASGEPMTAAEVRRGLDDGLAYTTVVTILGRLHQKGLATRGKHGRSHAYSAVEDQAGPAARRMHKMLDAGPDRDSVLARFVSDLSDHDERVLRILLHGGIEAAGDHE